MYLRAANDAPTNTYKIEAGAIWFAVAGNSGLRVKEGMCDTNTTAAGSSLGVAGGASALLSPVAGLLVAGAGMKATDDAESVRENFVIKHFQNVTLSPGKSADGFVYFVQPGPISPACLPCISIPVQDLLRHQTNVFTSSLTLGP